MSPQFTEAQLLSHLKECRECGYYVCAPILCKGQNDPSKTGYWYEKCLKNAQPTPNSCNLFDWRPDLPRGAKPSGGKKTPCPGVLCKQASKPNTCNVECTFGVCVKCCRHLQALLSIVRSCGLGEHRKGVVYPTLPANDSQPDPAPPKRGRGRPKKADSKADNTPSVDVRAGSRSVPVTPSRAPPKPKTFATPTGPPYQARMCDLNADKRLEVERQAERFRQHRAQTFLHKLTVRWWKKDGGEPELAEVAVENLSSFHPKDAPHLVDHFHCDTEPFEYYDPKKCVWYTGSKYSAGCDLNKLGPHDLCYRSEGVTSGQGMPGQTKKRPAPDDSPLNESPRRPIPPFPQFSNVDDSHPHDTNARAMPPFPPFPQTQPPTPRRWSSPTATEPPMSGSTAYPDETDLDPFFNAFDFTPTAFDNGPSTYSAINASQPPLPALFPTGSDVTASLPSMSTAVIAPQPVELDLSTAPRGRGAKPWPWRYVCDMAAGFAAIRRLEDSTPIVETSDTFEQVFKGVFKPTTYGEQL